MRKAEPCSGRVNSSGEQYYPIITAPKCGESSVSKSKGKNLRECLLFLLVFVIIANILLPGPDARISNGYSTVTPPHQTKLGLRPTRSYAWGVDPNFVDFQFHLYRIGQGLQAHAAKVFEPQRNTARARSFVRKRTMLTKSRLTCSPMTSRSWCCRHWTACTRPRCSRRARCVRPCPCSWPTFSTALVSRAKTKKRISGRAAPASLHLELSLEAQLRGGLKSMSRKTA